MTTVIEQLELSNTCTCTWFEDGEFIESTHCFGECYENDFANVEDRIALWVDKVATDMWDTEVVIATNKMNWDGRAGITKVPAEDIIETLKINAEWRLVFKFEGDSLKVVRYSHDEPTGATFYITALVD
jgi:hypothetical protein